MFREQSISEIHSHFVSGSLSPVAVAEECIARYERLNSEFKAWVNFDSESLIRNAEKLLIDINENKPLRPLSGIPVGVKDVFNTTDFPTQMGSKLWEGFTPGNDARVVHYIKNAGGVVAGKTVTAEFAVHALNETLNPHNIEVTPGTSSSGSAVAVALGMVPVALGTQTGASIIRPASFCGVYGFKPSFGLIPRTASLKTTDSLDTIGFFVSCPQDIRRVLEAVRVKGPNFPISYNALRDHARQNKSRNRPWKIALVKTHTWSDAKDYAKASFLNFANKIGANNQVELVEIELPLEMEQAHEVHKIIYDKSLAYYFKEEYKNKNEISEVMKGMIDRGERITAEEFFFAINSQNRCIGKMDVILQNFDAAISLSTAGAAPLRQHTENPDPSLMWTLTHLPALHVPKFSSPDGNPFGFQIIARKYNDHLLLNFLDFLTEQKLIPNGPWPCIKI